jgi:multiple sugar transport system permease protein
MLRLRKYLVWYTFVAPTFILFALFIAYPTFETFRLSFYQEVATQQQFVGALHFVQLLSSDIFIGALFNTAILGMAFLVLIIPISLIFASLINTLQIWPNLFKVVYFLPQITSTVAVALIFSYVYQPNWGLINGFLHGLGVQQLPLWLAEPRWVPTGSRAAVTLMAVWVGLGYYILVFLAGLQAIPAELYDAAKVDGAGSLQQWWHITVPSLRPSFVFLILTGTIDGMSRFSDLWMMGGPGGAPARSLQTIVMFIYQTAFENNNFNLASAASVIFFGVVLVLTLINFQTFLRHEFTNT